MVLSKHVNNKKSWYSWMKKKMRIIRMIFNIDFESQILALSSWGRKNCLQSWANSQNDNYFHSKLKPRTIFSKTICNFFLIWSVLLAVFLIMKKITRLNSQQSKRIKEFKNYAHKFLVFLTTYVDIFYFINVDIFGLPTLKLDPLPLISHLPYYNPLLNTNHTNGQRLHKWTSKSG